jgi:hypothetical protein
VIGCGLSFSSDHISPEFGNLDNVEMVYMSMSDEKGFIFLHNDGSLSEPFKVGVNLLGHGGGNVYAQKQGGYMTWSPNGEYLALIVNPYSSPTGYPVILSIEGEIITCKDENLPTAESRVWIINGLRLVTPDTSASPDRVVIYDFQSCQLEEVLYTASEDEDIGEATLSTAGWLAVSYWNRKGELTMKVIDLYGNEYLIPDGEEPSWSPDGELLAFVIQGEGLYIFEKDSGDLELVQIGSVGYPTWSPDGEWIAYHYCCVHEHDLAIYKTNILTSGQILIIENGMAPNWRWSIQD